MRDVGILVWVGFLVIGVIGSMVSSARRQAAAGPQRRPQVPPAAAAAAQQRLVQALQARAQAQVQAPASSQRPPQPRPAPPRPASPPRTEPPRSEPPAAPAAHRARQRSFFGTGPELVRAVIAAEVLGKPRGLNDEYR
jgi:hypothetical protein